jgi:TonB-linked SusC/RagA family outer membrane protein
MGLRRVLQLLALAALASPSLAGAQSTGSIRGRISDSTSREPVAAVQLRVEGTTSGTQSGQDGSFTLGQVPAGSHFVTTRRVGFAPQRIQVTVPAGGVATLNLVLGRLTTSLDAVVVTALGQTAERRSLGTSEQTVGGQEIAETQRPNFVNALQGRIAGVNVTSSSGVPGASTSITIRGVSSISSSNQPLFIIDGLPMDNKTMNSNVLASDAPGSGTAFNNRGLDFTNRAADINPDDIESLVVLKGPEAAALYGIDAANGAIVITTKRGRPNAGGFTYSNSFRAENVRNVPNVQRTFGPITALGTTSLQYFGAPYADTTKFYDNIDGFFRTGMTQQHNLSFSGAAPDNRVNYRLSGGLLRQNGVIPNSAYDRINVTGATQGRVNRWLSTDLSMTYSNAQNDQSFKGDAGPLIGLLIWPQTDDARDFLTPAGTRRRLVAGLGQGSELDNPYFNVNKNRVNSRNSRYITNLGVTIAPLSWVSLKTNLGVDGYTNQNQIVRNPESATGFSQGGIYDGADDITRNINAQTLLNFNDQSLGHGLTVHGLIGNQITDAKSTTDALNGVSFLDPTFVSINNTGIRSGRTTINQRRLIGLYGQAVFDYNRYLYLTLQGRNDWTSTIPTPHNSFFYPSVTSSFIFTDAFPSLRRYMTGKLRAAYAEVGKDARPYADRPSLEFKTTTGGGYGYGFTGPNPLLRPEFAKAYEGGTELTFLNDRLGVDLSVYRKTTSEQIVNDIRGPYPTGFILFNLNGASTRNNGVELSIRGTPVRQGDFAWDFLANFDHHHGTVLGLPNALPESYVSDTQLIGNVRNGSSPGRSTESLTGLYYLRADSGAAKGQVLIDPTSGLPIRSPSLFLNAGYDRTPKYTVGLTNTFKYKKFALNFLLDFRRGGDIFNATEWYLTTRGLSKETLDRNTPRVVQGVLRDGKENTANPTKNTIVVVPSVQTGYYTSMSEELFIQKNINWVRLQDVRLTYQLPARLARNASVYVSGTDLFLITNYTGLDPIVNGNTAAVGGSGATGIDFGNLPIPRAINAGFTFGF